ncbi:MAG: hypothetical protein Q8N21_05025 [bacterium]|nr:hypothetical protein [bacterium]
MANKTSKARQIDFYDDDQGEDLRKISRPKAGWINEKLMKQIVFALAFIIVAAAVYWLFFAGKVDEAKKPAGEKKWYAVELASGEMFFGQIADTSADPVVLENVYYDYDQIKKDNLSEEAGQEKSESANLRLVKRGKETHGPSGEMEIVRTQVVFMEPLAENSKVLKAILEYEK